MHRVFKFLLATGAVLGLGIGPSAKAAFIGSPLNLKFQIERIRLDAPALPPMAHIKFCIEYPDDCRAQKIVFRGGAIKLTKHRLNDLVAVNAQVNRSIEPLRNTKGITGEEWVVAPAQGDCNDFAVTKRHALLERGWPSRALLLAEVITSWGEHHLVLVVRTHAGDLVVDNLNANIRPWSKTNYRWVRMQSPQNPRFWSTVTSSVA